MDPSQAAMIQALQGAGGQMGQPGDNLMAQGGMPKLPAPVPMPQTGGAPGMPPGVPMTGQGTGMLGMPPPAPMPMQEPYMLSPQEQEQWQRYLGSMEK